ncbi:MAG: glycoside hydrolase family 2 TIM barrel-domain containing protein [Anaerolineae bacterium]
MILQDLNGTWKLQEFDPGEGVAAGAFSPEYDDASWLPAAVPGDVHTSLVEAGRLEPIFYHMNVEKCQWVERREWWYRTRFIGPDLGGTDRQLLVFDGLDTYATVYLNGEEIGSHQNMFVAATFDVTGKVRPGEENVLAVRFDPVLDRVGDRQVPGQWAHYGPERVWVRKAQCNFSWDWGPRLVSVGLWQGVRLEGYSGARLADVFFRTEELSEGRARVLVTVEAETWRPAQELTAQVSLTRGDQCHAAEVPVVSGVADIVLDVPSPDLWWTHDLGEPALYDLAVALKQGEQVVDSRSERVGIRTIEVDQSPDPDEPGTKFFRFVLNGVPIFAKGADWIPADSFVAQVTESRYRDLLQMAVDAHMNMLRVWGGGIYEKPEFYRLCDELGILIWQDFMFACARYPDYDPEFYAEVRREAELVVRRLRNRPCLALWCGNNENDWIDDMVYWWDPGHDFPGRKIYHELLPEIVSRLDPTRLYWPSSPYGGNDHNDEREGDRHNWQTWHGAIYPRRFGEEPRRDFSPEGVSFRHYAEDPARFISEFGMHAAPVLETLRRNVPPEELYFGSEGLLYRNKDNPKDKGNNLMLAHTGLPKDLDEYIDFSMIAQAEGLKFGIEHYRRRKPHCSGTLFWQLNDVWPGLSWSVIDYYGFPKAGYFYVRRAYAPVMASFKQEVDGGYSLWIVNDTLRPVLDGVLWGVADFDGARLWEEALQVTVPANASMRVGYIPASRLPGDPRRTYLFVRSRGGTFPDNREFRVEVKDLVRPRPALAVGMSQDSPDELTVRVSTDVYAFFVKLVVPIEGTRFSDNYFDIFPGEERTVRVWNEKGLAISPKDVEVSCR